MNIEKINSPVINGSDVTFIYYGKAYEVYLTGEYNQWELEDRMYRKSGSNDVWYINKSFPENARFDYKFVVDGNWITDPLNENKTVISSDNINSNIIMPRYKSDYEKITVSEVPRGDVIRNLNFNSDYMGCKMKYHVYLPNHYDKAQLTDILYALDGSDYLNYSNINLVLDYMIHTGEIPNMAAILVDPNDRNKEYTINRRYLSYFIKELLPNVEAEYLSSSNNTERGITGVSWGGLTAIYIAVNTPSMFTRLLSQSGSFWPKDWLIFDMINKANIDGIKFCLQTGTVQDTEEMNDVMAELLQKKHINIEYVKYAESHNWVNWKGHLNEGLRSIYTPYKGE